MTADHYTLGWLPAVLPDGARRFRAADATLAAVLRAAGAELVDGGADVEIARSPDALAGEAPVAIVWAPPPAPRRRGRFVRAASKAVAAGRAVVSARRSRGQLRRRGYDDVQVLRWDVRHRVALSGFPELDRSLVERLPGGVLVAGTRGARTPTALEAALEAASRAVGTALQPRWASIRPGPVLVATDSGVLRVAIGPSRAEIDGHAAALRALADAAVPPLVGDRVPWLLAEGETGLARWSLERLRPGKRPAAPLRAELLDECLDFLVALHGIGGNAASSLAERAEIVATACSADAAARIRALAERLDGDLAGIPRGFGHGDFFAGNLLAAGDRLTGVLDWDAGGPGRLPLLDVLHLIVTSEPYGADELWGRAVIDRLVPLARSGGGETVRRYCRGAGLDPGPSLLEALVLAYWLEYAAYQLRTHPDRRTDRAWIEGNLELVAREPAARAVRPSARAGAPGALTREA